MYSILIIRPFSYLHFAYCQISEMLESHKRAAINTATLFQFSEIYYCKVSDNSKRYIK